MVFELKDRCSSFHTTLVSPEKKKKKESLVVEAVAWFYQYRSKGKWLWYDHSLLVGETEARHQLSADSRRRMSNLIAPRQ